MMPNHVASSTSLNPAELVIECMCTIHIPFDIFRGWTNWTSRADQSFKRYGARIYVDLP
jgi:hypothetical protein